MRPYIVLLIAILTFSCSSNAEHQNDEEVETNSSTPSEPKVDEPEIEKEAQNQARSEPTNRYTIEDIQGIWGSFDSLENAYYFIEGDSIFYLEGEAYLVEVNFDSMRIFYNYGPVAFKINWIQGDTMSYHSYGSEELILRGPR